MSTRREQLMQAVKARLMGATVAGDHVFRARAIPLERALSPAIVIRWQGDARVEKISADIESRDLSVLVEVLTRGDEPDSLADPLVVSAHAAMFSDPTFGGLCAKVIPGDVEFDEDEADQSAGITTAHFTLRYLARSSDPTARI